MVRESDGTVTVLSDLDMAVVVRDAAERDAWRSIALTWPQIAYRFPGADAVVGEWALGVYALDDLAQQPPKMGTVELACGSLVLAGDARVCERVQPRDASQISVEESFRLIATRAVEQLRARAEWAAVRATAAPARTPEGVAARRLAYASLKTMSDLGTALLSATGGYAIGRAARAAALERAWTTAPLAPLAASAPDLPLAIACASAARLGGGGWSDLARAAHVDATGVPDIAEALDRSVAAPFTPAAAWLLRAVADHATAGGRDASAGAPALAAAAKHALLSARPRGAIRTWLRLARRTGEMSSRMEILRLAALHRFAPPPWMVAAIVACFALAADEDETGMLLDAASACVGHPLESPAALQGAALRTARLLSA